MERFRNDEAQKLMNQWGLVFRPELFKFQGRHIEEPNLVIGGGRQVILFNIANLNFYLRYNMTILCICFVSL